MSLWERVRELGGRWSVEGETVAFRWEWQRALIGIVPRVILARAFVGARPYRVKWRCVAAASRERRRMTGS